MSEDDPVETGSKDFTLTCTVHEVISGLVNMPSAHWMEDSSLVTSGGEIVVTETLRNTTTAIVTLTFSTLHTSHAGQYMCQGTLVSPAAVDDITSEPANVSVDVSSKCYMFQMHYNCACVTLIGSSKAPPHTLYCIKYTLAGQFI